MAYVESTVADIEVANALAHAVLGQSLDELAPQTRRLLVAVHAHVSAHAGELAVDASLIRFTRRGLREAIGWGDTQLKVHLARLVDLELLLVHRAESGTFTYELAWRPPAGDHADADVAGAHGDVGSARGRFLVGLTDPKSLTGDPGTTYDGNRSALQGARSGSGAGWSGAGRPLVGGWSGAGRPVLNGAHEGGGQPGPAPEGHDTVQGAPDALIGLHESRRGA